VQSILQLGIATVLQTGIVHFTAKVASRDELEVRPLSGTPEKI
jgi:hypothetical protein